MGRFRGVQQYGVPADSPANLSALLLSIELGSGAENLLDALNHFVMVQQVATAGRRTSFLHGLNESSLVLQHAVDGFLDQL